MEKLIFQRLIFKAMFPRRTKDADSLSFRQGALVRPQGGMRHECCVY